MVSAHNYVHSFDFVTRIWSQLHDKDYLYILPSSKHSLFYTVTYKDCTLSLPSILTSSSQTPRKCMHSATFFFPLLPFQLDLFEPRTEPQKSRQTPKETNNQHGRRHMPSSTRCYIYIYIDTLHELLSPHIFYSLQDTFNISSFSMIYVLVLVHTHTHTHTHTYIYTH